MPGKKKVLIIGYGSVGKKHAEAFSAVGAEVILCTKSNDVNVYKKYLSIEEALEKELPDVAVISNVTADHFRTVEKLKNLGFKGTILIEKPLFEKLHGDLPLDFKSNCFITYNLRFHPCINYLRKELAGQKILLATVYCGQYLPTWRPSIDYRKNYSAIKAQGGGVLRDLSHELDYMRVLFGNMRSLSALVEKISDLEIDTDDSCSVLAKMDRCQQLSMNINYLDRNTRRNLVIITEEITYHVDLMKASIVRNQEPVLGIAPVNTYEAQAEAVLEGHVSTLATFSDGYEIVRQIEKIEEASRTKKVITL